MSRSLSPSSAAALEGDDLLTEILLRLPPQPSSLPRASLVCKQWRRLVSDPVFVRHFHIRHRCNPPLLGFFGGLDLLPTMDPPNRLPHGFFSLQLDHHGDGHYMFFHTLGCRHGLVLIFLTRRLQLLVWDPVTGTQQLIAIPPGFPPLHSDIQIHGAVLHAASDGEHFQFQVVMVGTVEQQHNARAFTKVYSSDTGIWGDIISTPLPRNYTILPPGMCNCVPDVLVGDSLYWVLGKSILEFDLGRQRLAKLPLPVAVHMLVRSNFEFLVMRADGGGLGCLVLSFFRAQLWKRKTDCYGVASWVLGKTIELDKLLFSNVVKERRPLKILGFAENNSVVLPWTDIGLFTIQLQSLQFKQLIDIKFHCCYHPFESVYTAGTVIGGGHDGAELLDKTEKYWPA